MVRGIGVAVSVSTSTSARSAFIASFHGSACGITGNLADRLFREPAPFHGHVIDFIQLPYFAIFNVADIFITGAAVLVIWLSMITQVSLGGVRLKERAGAADE